MRVSREELLAIIDEYLANCFARQDPPRASELALRFGLSRTRLNQNCRATLGITLTSFLKDRQIAEAKRLLATTDLTITTIAYTVGFRTRAALYGPFVKATGMTPQEFRLTSSQ